MHVHLGVNFSPRPGVSQFTSYEVTARLMLYVSMVGFLDLTVFREDARFNLHTRQAEPRNSTRSTLRSRRLDLLGADAYLAARPVFPFSEGAFCSGSFSEERPVETPEDERREIDDIVRTRAPDVMMLTYQPNQRRLPSIDRATMAAAIERARERGLKTVVQVESWSAAIEAIKAGAAAITQVPEGPIPGAPIAALRAHQALWIPTLSVHAGLADFRGNEDLLGNPLVEALTRERLHASYVFEGALLPIMRMQAAAQRQKRSVYLASVARAAAAGVPILAGSDAGLPGTFQGFSIHRELALLVEAGLAPRYH